MYKVADSEVVVKHTLTSQMWADMNTKPKQGRSFRTDRSVMMNCDLELSGELTSTKNGNGDGLIGNNSIA